MTRLVRFDWVYFLKHGKVEEGFAAQGIQSAAKKLDILQLSPQERRTYESYRESLHDNASWAEMVSITMKEGEAKGLKKGVKLTSEKIALRLISEGMSSEKIALMTDLSLESIQALRQQ